MKKIFSLVLSFALILTVITGCGNAEVKTTSEGSTTTTSSTEETTKVENVTLTWLNHVQEESGQAWINQTIEVFEKANPGVKFEQTTTPMDNYLVLLKSKLAAGDAPDTFDVDLDGNPGFVDSEYVLDLTGQPFLQNFITPQPQGPDGKTYGLTSAITFFGIFYNKDAFIKAGITAAPTTWTEFQQACDKLKAVDIIPVASGYKDLWTMQCEFHADKMPSIGLSNEGWTSDLKTRKTKWSDDTVGMTDVLKRAAYIYDNSIKDPFGVTWDNAQNAVVNGTAAMIINGSWTPGNLQVKKADINLGMFPFPWSEDASKNVFAVNGGAKDSANAYYGNVQCIYSKTPNKELMLKFFDLISSKENGELYQNNAKQLSSVKGCSVDFDPIYKDWSAAEAAGKVANLGAFQRDNGGEYDTVYCNELTKYLLSSKRDEQATLKALDTDYDKITASLK